MIAYEYNHTHVTSNNPEEVVAFFSRVLGATVIREWMLAGQKAWDVNVGGLLVRISYSTTADAALMKRKEKLPTGLHHLALSASNLDEAVADLKSKGVDFVLEPEPGSGPAFIKTRGDVLIEIIQKR